MKIDNVADLIAETLAQAGVKRIFGVVGDSLNGLTDALRKRKAIDWIHAAGRFCGTVRRDQLRVGTRTASGEVAAVITAGPHTP